LFSTSYDKYVTDISITPILLNRVYFTVISSQNLTESVVEVKGVNGFINVS